MIKGISDRLPGKNFMNWNGKALWECNAGKMKELGMDVFLISDEFSNGALEGSGYEVVERPKWIADDSQEVLEWFIKSWGIDEPVMLLQATNPMVRLDYLRRCKNMFEESDWNSLVSINTGTCKPDGNMYITRDGHLYHSDMWVVSTGEVNKMAVDIDLYSDYCIGLAIHNGRVLVV